MTGRAFVFTGVRQPFEAREFPLREVEPDGILVRVTVANICGSDLHGWHGRTPRSGPTVMGHEMTGRVAKLGVRVTADAAGAPLREGDRIVYSYFYPCRRCDPCRRGDPHRCVARRRGAARVVVLDRIEERLKLAQAFGADHVLNVDDFATGDARAKAVRELTGGGGHVVMELVGHPAAIAEGVAMTRAEGRYVVIGNIAADQTIPF